MFLQYFLFEVQALEERFFRFAAQVFPLTAGPQLPDSDNRLCVARQSPQATILVHNQETMQAL
jgi:hypothetical protein